MVHYLKKIHTGKSPVPFLAEYIREIQHKKHSGKRGMTEISFRQSPYFGL